MMSWRAGQIGIVLILAASNALAVPDRARSWAGTYTYEHSAGRTVGGSGIVVAYRLTVAPGRGNRDCLLQIEGFQTNETIVYKIDGDAAAITVSFHTYGDGRTVNVYGIRVYDVGAPLFGLGRSGASLMTYWKALTPEGVSTDTQVPAFERRR